MPGGLPPTEWAAVLLVVGLVVFAPVEGVVAVEPVVGAVVVEDGFESGVAGAVVGEGVVDQVVVGADVEVVALDAGERPGHQNGGSSVDAGIGGRHSGMWGAMT